MTSSSHKEVGSHYERAAAKYLIGSGLDLITQNFTCRSGEIDLIMRDKQTLVFIEVKYRKDQSHGHAAEAVTAHKIKKLIKTSQLWMLKNGLSPYNTDFRFDVVAIHQQGNHIEWLKNAITQG
jgi:putative endonuclease